MAPGPQSSWHVVPAALGSSVDDVDVKKSQDPRGTEERFRSGPRGGLDFHKDDGHNFLNAMI